MTIDPPLLTLLSYYRDAELRGAGLLLRLIALMPDDPEAQVELTRHVAEETRHAWLWTKRIVDLGAAPAPIPAGYQSRIGLRTIPRSLADLLALTIVVEERALARYQEHAARHDVDVATRKVLAAVAKDEQWHVAWIRRKLTELTAHDATLGERADGMMERYRQIDREVYAELRREEDIAFGRSGPPDGYAGGRTSQPRGGA
ncbi:MAG: ferritin-like domain-containing protein [bacterium]|nr:ferritin-like domain-containing protein [bacterium]